MKNLFTITLALTLTVLFAGFALAGEKVEDLKPQTKCPVMGGNIDKAHYADYKGQRVYFCCGGCDGKFKADPVAHIAKMKANGEKPEDLKVCSKCGEYKGGEKCCAKDAVTCSKCGMNKGAPGCCADKKAAACCEDGAKCTGKCKATAKSTVKTSGHSCASTCGAKRGIREDVERGQCHD